VLGEKAVKAAIETSQAQSPQVLATLVFLQKLVRTPDAIGPQDLERLRRAGLSDDAIDDATFVCALFTTYNRLGDTFRFAIPPDEGFEQGAKMLLGVGYGFPPPVAWLGARDT
jgi:alkylhydroperoxidase family enzyme